MIIIYFIVHTVDNGGTVKPGSMKRLYTIIITSILLVSTGCGCSPVAHAIKGATDAPGQAAKPGETISKPCIPDEPERIVVIKGIVADIPIDEALTLPPGPLKLCANKNGQTKGEGGGIASSFWTNSGDTGWGNGNISGEYFEDSDGKNRIRIQITLHSAPSEPAGVNKEYVLLASEVPRAFMDGNSKITVSFRNDIGIQNNSR
jgi:hypothetical protein